LQDAAVADAVRPQPSLNEREDAPLRQHRVGHDHQHHDERDVDADKLADGFQTLRPDVVS
jgi:hypothetical protein